MTLVPYLVVTLCFKAASAVTASCLAVLFFIACYRLVLHPLAGVPGPKLAAVSNIWHALHVRNGRMLRLSKTLHKQYGPVVRIGPNEVWFDSEEAFRTIYSAGSGFHKSEFYLATLLSKPTLDRRWRVWLPDSLDLLSERDISRYRLQRRLIGPLYRDANLKKHGPVVVDTVLKRVVSQIRSLQGAEVDLKEWMHIVAVECLGAVVLSWSPGYLEDKTDWDSSSHSYLCWRRKSVLGLFPWVVKLSVFSGYATRVFMAVWRLHFDASKQLKSFFPGVHRQLSRRLRGIQTPTTSSSSSNKRKAPPKAPNNDARRDLLADLCQLHKDKPEFNETYLRRMAVTNFGAGHETLCSALTSIMAMIGSHESVKQQVVAEIKQQTQTLERPAAVVDDEAYLRYTKAAIKEAQRLYPVIGMSLSRDVPETGFHAHGFFFPPGTVVGCSPVALHRNTDIFGSDADSFKPDRWFSDAERVNTMSRCNLTWGGGGRTCPGRNLAYLILHKVVPALLLEFDLEVSMPAERDIRYYFMAMLGGVKVRFNPRTDASAQGGTKDSKQ